MGRIGGSDACVFFSELTGWVGLVGLVGCYFSVCCKIFLVSLLLLADMKAQIWG